MFTTTTTTTGASTLIADYNDFVSLEADNDPVVAALGADWFAVGSTDDVDARDNTSTAGVNDVPIYDVDGNLLALNNAALWGTVVSGIDITPLRLDGTVDLTSKQLTGTLADGTAAFTGDAGALGDAQQPNVTFGRHNGTPASKWIKDNTVSKTTAGPMYALSSPITASGGSTPGTLIYGK